MLTLGSPFKIFWQSVKDLFDEALLSFSVNMLFVLVNLPFLGIGLFLTLTGNWWLAALLLLLGSPIFAPSVAGLNIVAQRISEGRATKSSAFFDGFRHYFRPSLAVFVPWMFGLVLFISNLQFYASLGGSLGAVLFILFLYLVIIWLTLGIYAGPLLIIQEDKRLRVVARNAAVMVFGRPIFTLLTALLMGILIILSVWLVILLLLVTCMFLSLWGFRATQALIKDDQARRDARMASAQPSNLNTDKGRGGQIRPRE